MTEELHYSSCVIIWNFIYKCMFRLKVLHKETEPTWKLMTRRTNKEINHVNNVNDIKHNLLTECLWRNVSDWD